MSIFKSVQKAEMKAESIKNEAKDKVNHLLDKTRVENEKKAKLMVADAYKQEELIDKESSVLIDKKKEEVLAFYQQEEERFRKIAEQNFEKTVSKIIEKVYSI